MQGSLELCHIKKWSDLIIKKEGFGLKQASDYYYKLVTKKVTKIFWLYSEANEQSWSLHWILLDAFFYIQLSFTIFLWIQKAIVRFIW